MDLDLVIRWFHLLGATVWIGGMIAIGAVVPALRSAGAEREQLQAMARRFGSVAWTAMTLLVATGIIQLARLDLELGVAMAIKLLLVGLAVSIAFVHQMLPADTGPGVRAAINGSSLLVALGILAAAVAV